MASPNSYADPYWSKLATEAEQSAGLPSGLLAAIVTKGERSNADQVSEAGARTPFQIIPGTRKAAIDKYGIDPYLSDENAADVAARLLKDSLDRNKGNAALAVAEYHGGTDPANWGNRTKTYVQRVLGAVPPEVAKPAATPPAGAMPDGSQSTFDRLSAASAKPTEPQLKNILQAYKSGQMSPTDAQQFEQDVNDGHIVLPQGQTLGKPTESAAQALPDGVLQAYNDGRMSAGEKKQLEDDVRAGHVSLPPGMQLLNGQSRVAIPDSPTVGPAAQPQPGLLDQGLGALEAGASLASGATTGAVGLVGGAAKGLVNAVGNGTFGTDQGANAIEQSAAQGMQAGTYAPRTQAGQAQTEAVGGVLQNALPVLPLTGELGALGKAAAPISTALRDGVGATLAKAQGAVQPAVDRVASALTTAPVDPTVALPLDAAVQTAKTATDGGFGAAKATQTLADQAMPDPKTVAAAERIGVADHLQADHVTTNQVYREMAQAVKSIPGSEARAQELAGLTEVGRKASDIIDNLGAEDHSVVDHNVKSTLERAQAEGDAIGDKLYAEIRAKIPASTEAPATSAIAFIKQQLADRGGDVAALAPEEKLILSRLSPKQETVREQVPGNPLLPGQMTDSVKKTTVLRQPTYAVLDDVRKDLGAAAGRAGPYKDIDSGLAKKLYSLLTEDQQRVADSNGLTDLFADAKRTVQLRKGIEDDLTSLFGKEVDRSLIGNMNGAVKALQTGDSSKLVSLLQATPRGLRPQVAASGLATAFRAANTRGPISFSMYARFYERLLENKRAHAALFSNLPKEARKQLSDLYRVSKGISDASRERITTGRISAVLDQLKPADTLAGKLYDVVRRNVVAVSAGTAVSSVAGPGIGAGVTAALAKGAKSNAAKAVDQLIASPEFAAAARSAGTPKAPAAAKALTKTPAFLRLVHSAGRPTELVRNPEQWVLQSLQSQNQQRTK